MFDLELSIETWRRVLANNSALIGEDLDELVQHLRDQVAALRDEGLGEEEAFHRALVLMGDYATAEAEYRKVYWGKLHHQRRIKTELSWRLSMLKNYLKIAWRNILREKGYAFINVVGLAVGIAFCALIFLYVQDELTFDRFHVEGDRIFRVEEVTLEHGSEEDGSNSGPMVLGPTLQADVPGIAHYVRLRPEQHYVRTPDASTDAIEEDITFADPAILKVFTFPLVRGNPDAALASPDAAVITETMAHKYFGDENPMGKVLQIRLDQTFEDFTVTGVTEDVPGNSSIQFSILLPFERLLIYNQSFRENEENWHFYAPTTFVELDPGVTEHQVEAQMPAFHRKYHADVIARQKEESRYDGTRVATYDLQPIRSIHFTSDSNPVYSYILSGIALVVLLLACINFMTLSIGRSARRAREVGVRKVVGARRRQIMIQFWGEAFLLSAFALLVGLLLAFVFLPVFNNLTDKSLHFGAAGWSLGAALAGLVILTGLVAGSYPALVLARFQPIETLANRLRIGQGSRLTKGLVVVQFALTVFLLTSTLVMTRQLAYTRSIDLGFDKEQVVVIPTSGLDAGQIAERFRTELASQPNVVDITASGNTLGQTTMPSLGFMYEDRPYMLKVFRVDANYIDFLGLDLVAGRDFSRTLAEDSSRSVIVNEALVHSLGFDDPVGRAIPIPQVDPAQRPVIIGVVRDYHFQSLYKEVGSVMLTLNPWWSYESLLVRVRPDHIPQTLDLLKQTWTTAVADVPFTSHFLDDQMQAQYANDQRWSQIIRYAALFAVLIACLGLLGLASLVVTRRTKEIGIRKVLGATVSNLVLLISKDFALLVALGVVIAAPVAYLAMQRWLQDFAYHVPLSWWVFLAAGLAALLVALLTVGYHAVKSALADPVKSLRYE